MNDHVNPREVIGGNEPPLADRLPIDQADLIAQVEALAARANALPKKLEEMTKEAIPEIAKVALDAGDLKNKIEKRRVAVKEPWLEGERTVDGFFNPLKMRPARVQTFFETLTAAFNEQERKKAAAAAAAEAAAKKAEENARLAAAENAERKGRERAAALQREKADAAAQETREAEERAAAAQAAVAPTPQAVKQEISPDVTMASSGEWQGCVTDRAKIDYLVLGRYFKLSEVEDALKRAVKDGVRACGGCEIKLVDKVSFRR